MEKRPSGSFTRREAARVLGCSRTRVEQLEKEGKIHCLPFDKADGRATHYFARAEVLALARVRGRPNADRVHGTIAAQIFELFRQTVDFPEIVIQTQQSPATVRALYAEYRRPLEAPPAMPELVGYDERARELDGKIAEMQSRGAARPPALLTAGASNGKR